MGRGIQDPSIAFSCVFPLLQKKFVKVPSPLNFCDVMDDCKAERLSSLDLYLQTWPHSSHTGHYFTINPATLLKTSSLIGTFWLLFKSWSFCLPILEDKFQEQQQKTGEKSQFCKICSHAATTIVRDRQVESEVWWSSHTGWFFWRGFCHRDCKAIVSTHSPTYSQGRFLKVLFSKLAASLKTAWWESVWLEIPFPSKKY